MKRSLAVALLVLFASIAMAQDDFKLIGSVSAVVPTQPMNTRQGFGFDVAATWSKPHGGFGFLARTTYTYNYSAEYEFDGGVGVYGIEAGLESYWPVKLNGNTAAVFASGTLGMMALKANEKQYNKAGYSTSTLSYNVQVGLEYMRSQRIFIGAQIAQPVIERTLINWVIIKIGVGIVI